MSAEEISPAPETWYVYVLECTGGKLYTGITNDLARRYDKHAAGKGAIYTRLNPPVRMLACLPCANKSEAAKSEYRLKQLSRVRKLEWVETHAGNLALMKAE